MAFEFSDRHIETYQTQGYTVFEQILPATLIADLRRVTDQAREMARDEGGAHAQRLQPIANYVFGCALRAARAAMGYALASRLAGQRRRFAAGHVGRSVRGHRLLQPDQLRAV